MKQHTDVSIELVYGDYDEGQFFYLPSAAPAPRVGDTVTLDFKRELEEQELLPVGQRLVDENLAERRALHLTTWRINTVHVHYSYFSGWCRVTIQCFASRVASTKDGAK